MRGSGGRNAAVGDHTRVCPPAVAAVIPLASGQATATLAVGALRDTSLTPAAPRSVRRAGLAAHHAAVGARPETAMPHP